MDFHQVLARPTDSVTDTSQIQRKAPVGPSHNSAALKRKPVTTAEAEEISPPPGPPEAAPNLLLGLSNLEDDADYQISKARKAKDQLILDGNIRIVNQIESPKEPLCTKYSEEFEFLAAGYSDGVIGVYKATSGELMYSLSDTEIQHGRAPCTCIKHRYPSKMYPITNCFTATYANGCVKCWSFHFNQCIYTIREKRQTFGITYHPRFPKFVTFGDDQKVHFYDEETKTQERILMPSDFADQHDGHMSRIFAACFHPKNNYELLTGGWDSVVQFWDLRQPYALRHISGVHICGEGLDINSRGTQILTCCFQSTDAIQLWDYGSGRRIASIEPDIYSSKLYCGKYISKDFIVNGGADPHLFRVVDLTTTGNAAFVSGLTGGVYSIDTGPQRKQKVEREGKSLFTDDVQLRMKSDLSGLPRIAFVAGKKVYQIEFY